MTNPCRWTACARLGVVLGCLLLPRLAYAQGGRDPNAFGPLVAVTPDNIDLGVTPNSSGNSASFFIKNLSTSTVTFSITCSSTGSVTCTGTDLAKVTLQGGAQIDVIAFFSVGITGGRIVLMAASTQSDTGWYNVIPRAQTKPLVVLRNRPDHLNRSLCLTAGAGEAAAAQCGDLLVSHAMPGFTTMGRERSPTLVYNSSAASPQPVVVAAITEGAGIVPPDSVSVELWVAGARRSSGTFAGWGSTKAVTRQIVLRYDAVAAGHATGAYPFSLLIQNRYPTQAFTDTLNGSLIVVNRRASELGAGVGIAGVEHLYFNQPVGQSNGSILWVGGDGSARLYARLDSTTWLAPAAGFRDTLRLSAGRYTRTLRYGVKVGFSGLGYHDSTTNRLNQVTTFTWNTTTGSLTSIRVPPALPANLSYSLAYDVAGKLDRITDPTGRILDATVSGGVLTGLVDPDGVATNFAYEVSGSGRMTSRTNRRRFVTRYEYANGLRLTKVTAPIGKTTTDGATAVTTFLPWDEQGLAGVATAGVDIGLVHVGIHGPRYPGIPDTAAFSVDSWGAPTRIVNAIGATTTLARSDPAVPALVTKVIWPNLRIDSMAYDARGNLLQVRDSTRHLDGRGTRVTRYTYKSLNTADSPDTVVEPIATRKTKYSYNTSGLTTVMTDPRGHQTTFAYHGLGTGPDSLRGTIQSITEFQVQTWQEGGTNDTTDVPINQVTSFTYDAKGNLRSTKSPAGLVTAYARDAMGRVTDVYDPVGTRQQWVYDATNRVTQTKQYTTKQAPPPGTPAALVGCVANQVSCADSTPAAFLPALPAILTTTYTYDSLAVVKVVDARSVPRTFRRDARGLIWLETDDFGRSRTATYDVAGLLLESVSRSGVHVTFTYDTLGRRTSMTYPQVVKPGRLRSETIPGDVIHYRYDNMGNQLSATSGSGSIERDYWGDGAIQQKRTQLLGLGDTLSYAYDQAGALLKLTHEFDVVDYVYNGTSGDLDLMVVRWAAPISSLDSIGFTWDGLGRRRQITYPTHRSGTNDMTVKYRYDMAGTLRRLVSRNGWTTGRNAFDFTSRNTKVDPAGRILRSELQCLIRVLGNACGNAPNSAPVTTNNYTRLGMLVRQQSTVDVTAAADSMGYDGSGNMTFWRKPDFALHAYAIDAAHNWVREDQAPANTIRFQSDSDGARDYEQPLANGCAERYFFYDGLQRMSGSEQWVGPNGPCLPNVTWVEAAASCSYDPEGQLARGCENGAPLLAFDGANPAATLAAGGTGWHFVHGPGVDDPLVGVMRGTGSSTRWLYWVTDGQGRQFAVADSAGAHTSDDDNVSLTAQYRYAGGTQKGSTFGADRFSSGNATQVSYFRNRAYDQSTGRWLQEDPIGVAGGLNLYQFNGNNPVTYTDPFGLCPPCLPGGAEHYARMSLGELRSFSDFANRPILSHSVSVDVSVTVAGMTRTVREPNKGRISIGSAYGVSADVNVIANTAPPNAGTLDIGGEHLGASLGEGTVSLHLGFNAGSPIGVTLPGSVDLTEGAQPVSQVATPDATSVSTPRRTNDNQTDIQRLFGQ